MSVSISSRVSCVSQEVMATRGVRNMVPLTGDQVKCSITLNKITDLNIAGYIWDYVGKQLVYIYIYVCINVTKLVIFLKF